MALSPNVDPGSARGMTGMSMPRVRRGVMAGIGIGILGVAAMVWWTERPHLTADGGADAMLSYEAPAGQGTRTVVLTDGSRVLLAPGSTLRSRGRFGPNARELELTGEAQFTVANEDEVHSAPFAVEAAGVRVEDIGTAFVLRTVHGQLLVSVTAGEVLVGRGRTALHEGEAVLADSTGAMTALSSQAARGTLAWTSGALLFNEEPLDAVAERLGRWTGRDITVDPQIAHRRLTAAFERTTPDEMLARVATMTGARVEQRGNTWALQMR